VGPWHKHNLTPVISPTHQVGTFAFGVKNLQDFTSPVNCTMLTNEDLIAYVDIHFGSVRSGTGVTLIFTTWSNGFQGPSALRTRENSA
jgi:hypothetical protein